MKLSKMMNDYAWCEAMAIAKSPYAVEGYTGPLTFNGWDDIADIVACDNGENDGRAWIALFQLKDGRYLWLSASCDCTGWDCRANGFTQIGDVLDVMVKFALGTEDRHRLGFLEPGDERTRDGG